MRKAPTKRRGRRPRAGTRASERVEVRLTLSELRALKALAARNGQTVADLLRLAALGAADDNGAPLPIVLSETLIARIVAGQKSAAVRPLGKLQAPHPSMPDPASE